MKKQNRQKATSNSSPPEKRVRDLELENEALKEEIEGLKNKLANASPTSDAGVRKLKEDYSQKSNTHLKQVVELKKKQDVHSQLSSQKSRSVETAKVFQDEVQRLKVQKVQLQCKMKLESMQFRSCKASLEKQILQLRKEQRRNEYKMLLLLALNQRQKYVLQQKTKEASIATKRLKKFIEAREASSSKIAGAKKGSNRGIQGMKGDPEVNIHLHEVGSEYKLQMQEMLDQIEKLNLESEMLWKEKSGCLLEDNEDAVKDSELRDLREEVTKLSSLVSQMNLSKAHLVQEEKSQVDSAQSSFSAGSSIPISPLDTYESENSRETIDMTEKPASGVCCSCSKKSLCKTLKCGCRAVGGSCGTSCGCASSKCTNRVVVSVKLDDPLQPEMAENIVNSTNNVEEENSTIPAATLQNKAIKNNSEMNEDGGTRKQPLRDVGNIMIKPTTEKPVRKKRGQKTGPA